MYVYGPALTALTESLNELGREAGRGRGGDSSAEAYGHTKGKRSEEKQRVWTEMERKRETQATPTHPHSGERTYRCMHIYVNGGRISS